MPGAGLEALARRAGDEPGVASRARCRLFERAGAAPFPRALRASRPVRHRACARDPEVVRVAREIAPRLSEEGRDDRELAGELRLGLA